ncbi:hypothetical protein D9M68_554590 [compost metagenome]
MPPASALNTPDSANAATLYKVVFTPMTAAPSSFSRIAIRPKPNLLRVSQATVSVASTSRPSDSS